MELIVTPCRGKGEEVGGWHIGTAGSWSGRLHGLRKCCMGASVSSTVEGGTNRERMPWQSGAHRHSVIIKDTTPGMAASPG